jgi:hypothetical protein
MELFKNNAKEPWFLKRYPQLSPGALSSKQ